MPRRLINRKTLPFVISGLLILGIGFSLGFIVYGDDSKPSTSIRTTSDDYKFISPLLFVKTSEENSFPEYRPLKDDIISFSNKMIDGGKVVDMSIYFRNLNTSQWVGVNTEKRFSPSSMLKVVTLIGVLGEVEKNKNFLKATVEIPKADKLPTVEQNEYAPKDPLIPGKTYTIQSLIEKMIIDSDNNADYVLRSIIGEDKRNSIHDDLQIPRPGTSEEGYTSLEYSRIFRTLYNATYLSHDLSEVALELLSKTNFVQGIVQGVPRGTTVSHKFGVRSIVTKDETQRELHDCGIVYFPNYPYFICVMTRGKDFVELESVLKEASGLVWQEVSRLHGGK